MAPSEPDRTLALCDLLLGAAHADSLFHDREQARVREMLVELHGAALPAEVEARIAGFAPAGFDLARAAAPFRGDSMEERRKLLHLVAAVHDADDELDLDEDEYLRTLAGALEVPEEELAGLVVEFEVEDLRDSYTRLKRLPPPIPEAARARPARGDAVDVDVDE